MWLTRQQTLPAAQPFLDTPDVTMADAYPAPPGVPPTFPAAHPSSTHGEPFPHRGGFDYPSGGVPSNGMTQDVIEDFIKEVSEKKTRKDRNINLVFYDDHFSPEEKTAMLPKYARFVRTRGGR